MYYMHCGKIYAPRMENGGLIYDEMAVQVGDDAAKCIVNAGGSVDALPFGAAPMTTNEVLARMACAAEKPKRARKAVKHDVP